MTIRLWWIRPEDFKASPAALALLSPEERQQQQRFIPPAKRHEYLVTRVLVRSVLGEMHGTAPENLRFVLNDWGRPALAPESTIAPLHFNISHTEGLIVCLVSDEHQVGVDTEHLDRASTLLKLAPDVFAPDELRELRALTEYEQPQRAVLLWTLKESYIKARGMGLSIPLDSFAFRFDQSNIILELANPLEDDQTCWEFETHQLGSHIISATLSLHGQKKQVESRINIAEFTSRG